MVWLLKELWLLKVYKSLLDIERWLLMHKVAEIEVQHNIMKANKKLADKNQEIFNGNNVFCVDFVGAIGSG